MSAVFKGRLERWYEDKGFGFIQPEESKKDVFIHISALKNMPRRPVVGDLIYYQLHVDGDGKVKAINARIEGVAAVRTKTPCRDNQKSKQNQWAFLLASILLLVVVGIFLYSSSTQRLSGDSAERVTNSDNRHELILNDTFQRRISNFQIEGEGRVSKVLPDDTEGDRHQRFIVTLISGQSILIAHNISLAKRIDSLKEGDSVAFNGEYEWNAKGGVIHWTHRDPQGSHVAGWLKHKGQLYQ
jgi:cold shock CspA family protein